MRADRERPTGGGDLFWGEHHRVFVRPLEVGDKLAGSFRFRLVR
jgi:hypothetical protein